MDKKRKGECMKLSAIEISDNWSKLQSIVDESFTGDRLEKIRLLQEHFKNRMMVAPASGVNWFHNAFPGGYVAHILNVINWSKKYYGLFDEMDMYVDDLSDETVVFCAMFHDLGKVGNLEKDYYVPNPDGWKAKKYGRPYDHNPELNYMTVTDRAIWILNQFEIPMSETEYIGIRMADGLYADANKPYFLEGVEWKTIKTNIGFIVHYADCSAARQEKEKYMFSGEAPIDFPKIMKGITKEDPVMENLDVDKLEELFK